MHVCVEVCALVNTGAHRSLQRVLDLLELELKVVVSRLMWVLNSGCVPEQWVLLTLELSLQPHLYIF